MNFSYASMQTVNIRLMCTYMYIFTYCIHPYTRLTYIIVQIHSFIRIDADCQPFVGPAHIFVYVYTSYMNTYTSHSKYYVYTSSYASTQTVNLRLICIYIYIYIYMYIFRYVYVYIYMYIYIYIYI